MPVREASSSRASTTPPSRDVRQRPVPRARRAIRAGLRHAEFHHRSDGDRRAVDRRQRRRLGLPPGPLSLHRAQPRLLDTGRLRRTADPARPDPSGRTDKIRDTRCKSTATRRCNTRRRSSPSSGGCWTVIANGGSPSGAVIVRARSSTRSLGPWTTCKRHGPGRTDAAAALTFEPAAKCRNGLYPSDSRLRPGCRGDERGKRCANRGVDRLNAAPAARGAGGCRSAAAAGTHHRTRQTAHSATTAAEGGPRRRRVRRRFHCVTRAGASAATARHSADRTATPLAIEGRCRGAPAACSRSGLLGRARERDVLGHSSRERAPAQSPVLVLRGEAVGKTSLLRRLSAATEGCRIVWEEVTDGLLRLSIDERAGRRGPGARVRSAA